MKIGASVFGLCLLASAAFSQPAIDTSMKMDGKWQYTVETAINAAQSSYSNSWVGGEVGSLNWAFNSRWAAWKLLHPKVESRNVLKLAFGQTLSQVRSTDSTGKTETHWQKPRKSTDLIDFESVFRFLLNSFVDPYAALRFESYFTDESVPDFRLYFTPMRFTESAGIMKVFSQKPSSVDLRSRLGFAFRQTISKNIVDTALKTTSSDAVNDGGIESVSDMTANIQKNLSYTTKLTLFKAIFNSEEDQLPDDDWKAIDANWEHQVTASISKYIQTFLYFQMLYDKEIDKRFRIKETLGIGLAWKTQG